MEGSIVVLCGAAAMQMLFNGRKEAKKHGDQGWV